MQKARKKERTSNKHVKQSADFPSGLRSLNTKVLQGPIPDSLKEAKF
jgi:hypothetical protein